jgi:hypothetical protein
MQKPEVTINLTRPVTESKAALVRHQIQTANRGFLLSGFVVREQIRRSIRNHPTVDLRACASKLTERKPRPKSRQILDLNWIMNQCLNSHSTSTHRKNSGNRSRNSKVLKFFFFSFFEGDFGWTANQREKKGDGES